MIPSRSRRNTSRRSSILKPPKARHPLQTVDFNSSSSETSPAASKQKRRVSFAEKKHVKEFCDSLEQGTVWDNTYEENDLSNSKLPNVSLAGEKPLEPVPDENKMDALANSTNPVEKCIAGNKTSDVDGINIDVVKPLVSVTSTESLLHVMSQKSIEKQDTHSLNAETEITKLKPPVTGTLYYKHNFVPFDAQNKENVNCLQFPTMRSDEDLMQMTGIIPFCDSPVKGNVNIHERGIARKLFNNKDNMNSTLINERITLQKTDTCQNMSMEMTGVVGMYAQTHQEKATTNLFSDKTQYFQDISMDITGGLEDMEIIDSEQIACSTQQGDKWKNITQACYKEPGYNLEEDRDIRNISMEFTMAVSNYNKPNVLYQECIPQFKENYSTASDKSQIFQNVSMEMTEAVHIHGKENRIALNYPESDVLENVPMEFTTAIRSIPYDIEENIVKCTDMYRNDEATSHLQKQHAKPSEEVQRHVPDNRTMLIQVPMEMTEAVPIYPQRTNTTHEDQTKIFYNESVAFTEIVPASCAALPATSRIPVSKSMNSRKFSSINKAVCDDRPESTKIFNNEQVSFTEAVPSSFIPPSKHDDDVQLETFGTTHGNDERHTLREHEDFIFKNHNLMSNKTVVQDLSMEITKAVSGFIPPSKDDDDVQLERFGTIHGNDERHTLREREDFTFKNHHLMSNKTVVQDLSMEITKAVSGFIPPSKDHDDVQLERFGTIHRNDERHTLREREDFHYKKHNLMSNKTIVQDLSMEITKAVSSLPTSDSGVKPAEFNKLSIEECIQVKQSYNVVTTQKDSTMAPEKRQDVKNTVLAKKISATIRETVLPVTSMSTSSNPVDEQQAMQSPTKSRIEYISREDNCLKSKYNEMSLTECNKGNYLTSVTSNARHKNLSMEEYSSPKSAPLLSQQTDVVNYCNESPTMISEADNFTSKHAARNSEKFQSADAETSESAKWNLMKTFINDDIEELETIQPPSFVCSDNSIENSIVDVLHDSENNLSECQDDEAILEGTRETHESPKEMSVMAQECYKISSEISSLIGKEKRLHSKCGTDMVMDDLTRAYEHIVANADATVTNDKEAENLDMSSVNTDQNSYLNIKDTRKEVSFTADSGDVMDDQRISSPVNTIEQDINEEKNQVVEDSMFIQDPFRALIRKIKKQAQRNDCIWDLYYENVEKRMIGISFISTSLLCVIYLADNDGDIATQVIKEVKIISRLPDADNVLISVVHKILVEKLNATKLTQLFGNREEVLPMLEHISEEVKLTMDFMFELKRLDDLCEMEISCDRISFVSHTNKMDIVVIVRMSVKPLSDIKPDDITVSCLLGHVKDDDVKKLITNIKKDSKFLRRYMNDVRDYIDLMEGSIAKHVT